VTEALAPERLATLKPDARHELGELVEEWENRRARKNFLDFAPKALFIITKAGEIVPLRLNKAQQFIHAKIEQQRLATGKVRAIIVKGRQQGACLDPETRVLTADLRWVRIADLKSGEKVVATDEAPHVLANGEFGKGRKLRTASVEAVVHTHLPAYRITLSDGRTLICSGNHRWLVRNSQTQWEWRSIKGPRALRVGWKLRRVTDTWGDATLDDAWFGGMIDGEGHFERRQTTGGLRLAVSQCDGPVLERMRAHCVARGYGAYTISDDGPRRTKFGGRPVHALSVSNASTMFRLMGLSRPTRMLGEQWWNGMSMPDDADRDIVSIEAIGARDLVDIQTTTGTFLAEGIVSHNSTYIGGRFYWRTTSSKGKRTFILTHEQKATDNLFDMTKRYHANCPEAWRPVTQADSAKELWFSDLDSRYQVATAGSKGVGRSATAQLFHGSEVAFWPNAEDHMAGIGQTVPNEPDTEVILESTGNGMGNLFHRMWIAAVKGESDYLPIFVPWFWDGGYATEPPADFKLDPDELVYQEAYSLSLAQMCWRRNKLRTDFGGDVSLFNQEYPATPEMAFMRSSTNSLFTMEEVALSRQAKTIPSSGREPRILGVDPAEYGDDDSALTERIGRKVPWTRAFSKKGTMELAGIVGKLAMDAIKAGRPYDAINVDVTGVGTGVADRLIEQGILNVNRVHFGGKAYEDDKYVNRRAECWGRAHDWIVDVPNQIADDDVLQTELCSVSYSYDSSRRMVMESKEHMKKQRGLPSPDKADSFVLTFAENVSVTNQYQEAESPDWRVA
jgi:hypothetical protein